jgi:hypothetical protein
VAVTGYGQGDLNYDGVVNDDDLNFILANYSSDGAIPYFNPPAPPPGPGAPLGVPEPSTVLLLLAGIACGLMAFAKKRFV